MENNIIINMAQLQANMSGKAQEIYQHSKTGQYITCQKGMVSIALGYVNINDYKLLALVEPEKPIDKQT